MYERPHQAACELLNRLYTLPELKNPTGKELQHMSNVANDVKRQLAALQYDTEHSDIMFIATLQSKLDSVSKCEWEKERPEANPTLDELLTFIERRARSLIHAKKEAGEEQEKKEQTEQKNYKSRGPSQI